MTKEKQKGDSGGAHPNTHSDKNKAGNFKGGQSEQAYYGGGQLGDEELAENENAPSTED
jgi:hypothetical protein